MSHETVRLWEKEKQRKQNVIGKKERKRKKILKLVEEILKEVI